MFLEFQNLYRFIYVFMIIIFLSVWTLYSTVLQKYSTVVLCIYCNTYCTSYLLYVCMCVVLHYYSSTVLLYCTILTLRKFMCLSTKYYNIHVVIFNSTVHVLYLNDIYYTSKIKTSVRILMYNIFTWFSHLQDLNDN